MEPQPERSPQGLAQAPLAASIALVPGSRTSCALITVLTVLLAIYASDTTLDPVLRTLYFAAIFGALHGIRRREPILDTTAFRLLEHGFLVLTLGFSSFTLFRLTGLEGHSRFFYLLSQSFEKGAVYLLGVSLITYGILLSLPSLIVSYRILHARFKAAEDSNEQMKNRIVDADRFQALGELAAGIAHDLRNPLTIVKTAAESLARKPRSQEALAEHASVIARNIEKAERTIASLLELGKPRALEIRECDLSQLTAEITTLVKPEARRRNVGIEQLANAPILAHTDPKQLNHALLNLVLNGMQASPPQARVRVRARAFHTSRGSVAALAVEDRGVGLTKGDRDRLFHPFFTTKDDGTGIGLLSCRRVISDLGGAVQLFPRHRGGARALILLPLAGKTIPRTERALEGAGA